MKKSKKSKKSNRGLALVLAVVLALTPMAGFPLTALATGDTATSQADASAAAVSALVGEGDVIIDENSFPDPAFRSFVSSEEFDKNNDGVLQRAELLAVTSIEFYYNSLVTNPEGIEFFTNLTTLRCFQDSLTALDLTKNTALTTLYCRANFTLDLSSNTGLEELELKSSVCSSVDLTQNTKLKKLTLGLTGEMFEGPAVPLDLSHNKELTCLEIDEASMWLTSLDLSNNAELTELTCWYNSLAALDLSHNTKLTQVYCNNEYARVFWARQGSGYVCNLNSVKGFKNLDKVSNMKIINERQQDIPFTFDTQTGEIKVDERPGHVFYIYDTGSAVVTGNSSFIGDLYPYFTYGITATDDGNGSISPAGTTVVREGIDEKTYTFQPNPGYELGSVTVDGKPVTITNNTYTFTDVHADTTIHATFKALPTYNITATVGANGALVVGGNGMLDPSGIVKVQEKTDQSFTIKPNDGYELDTLLVDNVDAKSELQGNTYTFTDVRAAHSIAVTFAAIAEPPKPPTPIVYYYNVTATVENGTITPFGTIAVREGSSQAYTFAPNEGYEFATVSVNGEAVTSSDSNAYTLTDVRAVTAIHVTFKESPVPPKPPVTPTDPVDPPKPPVTPTDPVDPPKPPVTPTDPVDPPKPPVTPTDPVDPPKPPVTPTDPVDPPKPPTLSVPDNGGTTGNNTNTTPVVERNVPQTLPAAQTVSPATPATDVAQTEATPTKADTTTAPKGPLENPALGAQSADAQHSHIPLILLLLAVWLVGGIAVIRQRKRTHDAVDNATRTMF